MNFIERMEKEEQKKKEEEFEKLQSQEKVMVKEYIEKANDNELLKKNHKKVFDTRSHIFFKITGILFLLILAAGIAGFLYLAYNGNFKAITSQVCGSITCEPQTCNPTVNCPAPPACPACSCPDCNPHLNCGNVTS